MTDIREICSGCREVFSPLSSARGIEADYCYGCLSIKNNRCIMLKELKGKEFFVLDTETTGLDNKAETVELGLIDQLGNKKIDCLIIPTDDIPAEAENIHGISTDEAIENGFKWEDVFEELCDLVNGKDLVIYNRKYDIRILEQTCKVHGVDFSLFKPANVYCAMVEYGEWYGIKDENHHSKWQSLINASKQQGVVVENAHRAAGDCLMTLKVIQAVWKKEECNIV